MTTIKKEDEGKIDFWQKFKQSSLGSALHIDGIRRAAETLCIWRFIWVNNDK